MTDEEIDKLVKIANHKAFRSGDRYGRGLAKTANLLARALDATPDAAHNSRCAIASACEVLLAEAAPHFDVVYGDDK